ncbi:uncharacterized protein K452DRAFT_241750 [Aplosporella prunicola CBS 121167]|uniref:Isochorismatase-like domain-containing protein n=1 Tax=Aplosporella prunicola CBS 121167 TaxID=1176127 RepID=A0A6A6BSE7_9PEZI|nr:uncharacterized protein K452DRAFT_241750 [Aplosporella prunicola CBS 121167]KAF2146718.1 hypothetical protein K452DRAFT_241750 [Aplosporella prunicola CBS 121167]
MAPSAIDVVEEFIVKGKPVAQPPLEACSDPVPFGGDDKWFYIPETRRFDLTRGSERRLVLDADDGIRNHRGCVIDPEKTILVVIDMQNYFIHPVFRDHAPGLAAVDPTIRVIEKCRKEGIQVAWLNWGIDEYDLRVMPPAVQRGFSRNLIQGRGHGWHVGLGAQLAEGQGRCLFKGTWNADLYEPLKAVVAKNDLFFDKNRMSGMWSPDEPLHRYLRESEKKTILFAGVNTDQCLLGTLTDSYSWGFDCILLSDCSGTMTGPEAQVISDYNIATNMGRALTISPRMSLVNISLSMLLLQLFFLCLGAHGLPTEQQILQDDSASSKSILSVRAALKKAEIIPTVIDDFLPQLTLNVTWPTHETADLGNKVKPEDLQKAPSLTLDDEPTSATANNNCKSNMTYTVALTDPDAPSRDNPEWSEICHWIITGVPLTSTSTSCLPEGSAGSAETETQIAAKGLEEIIEYKPPGPPPKTGAHRYVFLAFAPANSTSQPLDLTKPKDRQHWGTGKKGHGVRQWAEQNGLVPVAANFIYSKNKEQ